MKPALLLSLTILISSLYTAPSYAGPYTDELSKCIIEKTTAEDKVDLMKWMFYAISLHPDLKNITNIPEEMRTQSTKSAAKLMEVLMADRCVKQLKTAVQYEGNLAIEASFSLLGQVASKELFVHSEVSKGVANLEQYFDSERVRKALENTE